MNKSSILVALTLVLLSAAIYHLNTSFARWQNPYRVTDSMASDLAYYLTENLTSEGAMLTMNDLDDPLLQHRKIVLGHALNESTAREVVRKLLYLNAIDSTTPIDLYISTEGGWYNSTFTIIDTFQAIKAPVNTICIGGCYSAGLVLVASGTGERIGYANTHYSAHISYGGSSGEKRPFSEQPDRVNGYLQRVTQLPRKWFPLDDDRQYYLTADNALKYGIIDRIEGQPAKAGKKNTSE